MPMDKFGVDEGGEDLEKKAAKGCPLCGRKPTRQGRLLFCPAHGSEPFEQMTPQAPPKEPESE